MKRNGERFAVYSRKSRFTGKGESIGNQIELCKSYLCNLYGEASLEMITVFEDEGFSGGNMNRPAFQKMMEGVRRREFRAIVVYRLDRISRNISDFTNLIDELTKLDVSFVSIREQFDTSTPMGRAMMFIISVFSQLERETIAERIRDNMHELAKTGRWLGGNTPTGYGSESVSSVTVDGKTRKACRLKLIPEEAAVVRTIFDLYTQTDSLTATEAELLRRRIKTKRGNDFTRFSIKGILRNPVYITADEEAYHYFLGKAGSIFSGPEAFDGTHGLMVYNRTDQEKGKAAAVLPVEEWIIAVGRHPGLIPSAQWIRVQASLDRNQAKDYRKPRTNGALLTGVIYCGCGGRMYPKLSGRTTEDGEGRFFYVCKLKERSKGARCGCRNADGNALDAAILEQLRLLPECGRWFSDRLKKSRLRETKPEMSAELTELRGMLAENEKKIEGLLDCVSGMEEAAAKVRIAGRIERLVADNQQLECRLRELESQCGADGMNGASLARMRARLESLPATVDAMTVEEKRDAVRTVADRVVWDGENARLILWGAEGGETALVRG